jgi:phosphatidylserine/phosphatidylglycerophosphate/cardiolipin synthase-like enzyme
MSYLPVVYEPEKQNHNSFIEGRVGMRHQRGLCVVVLGLVCNITATVWYDQQATHPLELEVIGYLDMCQQRAWVAQYRLTSRPCVKALIRARQRGVDVRIILDRGMSQSPAYSYVLSSFAQAGIAVWWLGPVPLFHHKFAIIDNHVLTGSANWTRPGLNINEEGILMLDEPHLVQGYVSHYVTLMRRASGMREYTIQRSRDLFCMPDHKKSLRAALETALNAAQKRICIAMYSFTAPWCWRLLHAACKRGVCVQVLLDATQTDVERLRSCVSCSTIDAHLYTSSAGIMHHKLALIDDELWYGSMNWTHAGMRHNQENVVRSTHQASVAAATQAFTALFTQSAG